MRRTERRPRRGETHGKDGGPGSDGGRRPDRSSPGMAGSPGRRGIDRPPVRRFGSLCVPGGYAIGGGNVPGNPAGSDGVAATPPDAFITGRGAGSISACDGRCSDRETAGGTPPGRHGWGERSPGEGHEDRNGKALPRFRQAVRGAAGDKPGKVRAGVPERPRRSLPRGGGRARPPFVGLSRADGPTTGPPGSTARVRRPRRQGRNAAPPPPAGAPSPPAAAARGRQGSRAAGR